MLKLIYLIGIIFFNSNYLLIKNKTENISRRAALVKGKFFVQKCYNGELMNNNTNFKTDQPKISIIIPVYNYAKTIKASVRSIQNQDMAEIEIILVNDFSKNTSSNIINELSQEDSRIKVINNVKNMGALYSRNLGIQPYKLPLKAFCPVAYGGICYVLFFRYGEAYIRSFNICLIPCVPGPYVLL